MEASEVAAKLRACASEMKLASVTLRANADQLKETSRALGNEAAELLHPILLEMKAGPSAPLWEFMLPTLRKVLKKQVNPAIDREAFKVVREVDLEENAWTETNLREDDLTEPQRERFYFSQTREWAALIELAADRLRKTDEISRATVCHRLNDLRSNLVRWPAALNTVNSEFEAFIRTQCENGLTQGTAARWHTETRIPAFDGSHLVGAPKTKSPESS